MYKRILAPLDGSSFSEGILEHVRAIALGCKVSEVILFRVIEPVPGYAGLGENWHVEAEKKAEAWTAEYLARKADELKKQGINAKTAMGKGNAAEEILEYASKNKVDLIIMATHGSSGVVRWMLGGVADRVVRHASAPVLTVSPKGIK